jgi:hypothetical protein
MRGRTVIREEGFWAAIAAEFDLTDEQRAENPLLVEELGFDSIELLRLALVFDLLEPDLSLLDLPSLDGARLGDIWAYFQAIPRTRTIPAGQRVVLGQALPDRP